MNAMASKNIANISQKFDPLIKQQKTKQKIFYAT
jgi:hypothetical protein